MEKEQVQSLLEQHGEIIVVTDAGQEFELHSSDVGFDEDNNLFQWDAGNEIWYLDADCVESVQVHSSHRMSGA